MRPLWKLIGVGGAMIGGTMLAIAVQSVSTIIVLFALFLSAVVGGLAPVAGVYTGVGALLGFLSTIVLGLRAEDAWPSFIIPGMILGGTHALLLTRNRRSTPNPQHPRHESWPTELGGDPSGEKLRRLLLFVVVVLCAILLVLLAGPHFITSNFVWTYVAVGAIAGYALLVGIAVSRMRQKRGDSGGGIPGRRGDSGDTNRY
jgi:hypothetical protein